MSALTVEAIRARLRTRQVGRDLVVLAEVDSTNDALMARARAGAPAGAVLIAESQTKARGRRGQAWFSPPGVNLYASVLLRPTLRASLLPVFSFIASLGVTDALVEVGARPAIKWPNDVLLDGKKVAGSLAEVSLRGDHVEAVVLGVGVNLNVSAQALRGGLGPAARFATSVAEVLGAPVDRAAFAAAYLNAVDRWADTFEREGGAPLVAAWKQREIVTARRVEVRNGGAAIEGRVQGLDAEGHLIVIDPRGARKVVTTGDLRLLD